MDINGWLTVIAVFTAIFALLPKEDLFLRFQRTSPFEKLLFIIINIAVIPYLIFFDKIIQRWTLLENFTFYWGFDPSNIAFALFYISFLWLLCSLFCIPKAKRNKIILNFYIDLLNEKPFEEFFKLFTKYTPAKYIATYWEHYKALLFQPKFLNKILESKPSYLLQFWEKFNTENDFQSIFHLLLENPNSAYYSEIKKHWNSYSLLEDKPFLNTLIKDNLRQSIHNGILMVFTDHVSKHLHPEYGKVSIYNQAHYFSKISEDEGFELPLYYHIRFIGLIYSTAIKNHLDISTVSHKYTNMQTIFSSMLEQMINNLILTEHNEIKEFPTNYHWLISELFDLQSNWLTLFSDEEYDEQRYFDENSSYITFIPFSMSLCLSELYKGLNKEKITIDFLNRMIYYNVISHYFNPRMNDILKTSIENKVIKSIPKELLQTILDFSLDKKFAKSFDDLINEDFSLTNDAEKIILSRLLKFLKENDQL